MYFFLNWTHKLASEETKVPRTLCEARKVAGSSTLVKQYEIVLSFKISLFIQFIQSWVISMKEILLWVNLSILIKMTSPKLHTAPLMCVFSGAVPSASWLEST